MSSIKTKLPCGKCYKEVINEAIECSVCLKWYHRTCTKLTKNKFRSISIEDNWYCMFCSNILPFYGVDDDEFFIINSAIDTNINLANIYKECLDLNYKPFHFSEYSSSDFQQEVDPENNF